MNFSEYGGEILYGKLLSIDKVSNDSVIQYTTDGSDPMKSDTAVLYKEPIQLKESCKFTAAIVSGSGKETVITHNFTKIGEHSVYADFDYGDGTTEVTLSANKDSDIYYTTDNDAPEFQRTLLGDFNRDSLNTNLDIETLYSLIMTENFAEEQFFIGNFNDDDELTVSDVVRLRNNEALCWR